MVNKNYTNHPIVSDLGTSQQILLQWLAEIDQFQALYHKLSELLRVSETSARSPSYTGQCPLSQLTTLQETMQAELGTLLADTERRHHRSAATSPTAQQRLAAHGQILRRLNQRVQSSLQLATTLPT